MINNDFMVELIAALNNAKSTKQVNQDIKSIEKTVNALRLTATFLKGDSKKQLNAIIRELESNIRAVKVKTTFDSKQAQRAINDALKNVSINDLNINGQGIKLKARKIFTDIKSEISKTPIPINFEIRKDTLQNQLTTYLTKNSKISESSVLLGEADTLRSLFSNIDSKDSLRYATEKFKLFKSEVTATGFASKSTSDKVNDLIGKVTRVGTIFGIATVGIQKSRDSVSTLKEMSTLLTEIAKTSNIAGENLKKLGDSSFVIASKYGQTASNYLEGVREMARSGYDSLAKELGELSVLAQSAGDMTAEMANNYLLATDAAYKYGGSVEKLTAALDGANYISNRNSATLTDIADATRVSASFAAEAGVQIDQLTAAEATMVAATKRSGSEMGRAFRSILLNLQQVSGEFDGEVIDEEQLKKVEKRVHNLGVELEVMGENGAELRDPMQVLKELSQVYNSLPDNSADKRGLISDLGGKYHANALTALLSRWDMYEKMLSEFSQGSGSSLAEAMKTADSWEGRLNKLQNTWDSFVNSMTNQDYIKGGISFLDNSIQGFQSLTETVGALPVLLTAVNASLTALNKDYGLSQLFNPETRKVDVQGNFMGVDFTAIKAQKKHFEEASAAIEGWNKKLTLGQVDINDFGDSVVKNNAQLKDYLSTCSKDAPASLKGYQAYLNAAGISTDALRWKTVALNAAISFGIGAAVQFAITKVGKGISDYIHRNEIAISSADELKSTLESNISTINEHQSSLDSLSDRFAELSKGVDDYGNNVSLTKEQMKEYSGLVKDLIAINPALVKGYNSENQAIIDKNTALADTVALLERERQLELEKSTSSSNLKTVGEGAIAKRNELMGTDFVGQFGSFDMETVSGQASRFGEEAAKLFNDETVKAFYDYTNSRPFEKMNSKSDWLKTLGFNVTDEDMDLDIEGYLQRNIDTFSKHMDEILAKANIDPTSDQAKNLKLYVQEWQTLNAELASIDSGYIDEYLQKIPQLVSGYDTLTNSQKSFISEYIRNGFNAYDLENNAVKVKSSIVDMVEGVSSDENVKSAIDSLFALDAKDLNVTDYVNKYKEILDNVISQLNISDADANSLRLKLSVDADDLATKYENAIKTAAAKFDGYDPTQFFKDNSINTQEEIDAWLEVAQSAGSAAEAEKLYLEQGKSVEKLNFSSAFANLPIDKIEEYISLLNSGNITEKNISSFSELNDLMSKTGTNAENAVKSLKDYADGYTISTDLTSNIQSAYDLLKSVGEQYKKTGLIGLSSLESITKQYPQLRSAVNEYTQGLISADNMISQLQTAYDNDAMAYKTAMSYKLSGDEEFFSTIVNNNKSLFDDLSKAYGLDVSNWKTMAQAKAEIDQKLIQSLSTAWSKYYNIVFDSVSGLASIEGGIDYSHVGSRGLGAAENEKQLEQQKAWSEATKQANKYNQIISKLNEAASIQIETPDFGGIGSADKSGSKKDKKDTNKPIDWIARATKVLQDEYAKLEELANKDTIAYLGLTQKEFDKAKSIFDNGLGNSVEGLSQLQSYADKVGLSLGELYTMIQSGAPSASKENALQSMLEMQTDTLLPQYQREVEAYSKAYEDALKAIPSEYKDKVENGGEGIESLPSDLAEKVQAAIDANDRLKKSEEQLEDGREKQIQTIRDLHENRVASIDIENEKLQQSNKIIKSQMELMEARGKIVDADFYKRQINNNKGLISGNQKDIAEWESEMADLRAVNFDTNSKYYKELQAKVRAAKNEIYGLKLEQEEFNQTLKQMPIDHLSTIISMYGDITAKIENWGSVYSATGKKLDTEYYQMLISNGTTVIGQYEKQIREIKNLMSTAQKGSTVWQQLYDQLQNIDSATASMLTNLQKWNEELLKMPLDSINTYSDSLQKVITGLNGVKSELDSANSAITTAISDQISLLEEEQKAATDARQAEIDALQEKYDLLEKTNEKLKLQMSLELAEYNLARSLSQRVNAEIRDGEKVFVEDYDAVRKAKEDKIDAQFNIDKYNLEQQIEDAKTALDDLNDSYQDQIDALEKISQKYSEISSAAEKISNANLATSLFGEGWANKVLSGNDKEIYDTLTSLYQTNAKQLEEYQKQANSTSNIQTLIEDFISSYKAGEITYEQAMTKINGLLSQMNNNSMSAMDNLNNIFDYLGTVNGVGADADSILKGIKDGLSTTADELVKSLEEYNKNAGMISEHTSSWEQLTNNVSSMLDVLKQVRDNLKNSLDDYNSDDSDDEPYDKSRGKGWGIGDVNNGPGVYADGIKNGLVGSSSDSEREKMIKYLATNELKAGEVPIIAHEGEAILNSDQQEQLLDNVDTPPGSDIEAALNKLGLRKINPDEHPLILHNKEVIFPEEQRKALLAKFSEMNNIHPVLPDYSRLLNQITVRESTPKQEFNFGDINIQKCDNPDEFAKGIMDGKLALALGQRLGRR